MLIGLDAYTWAVGFDGFAEYTRHLARGLRDRGHDIRLYAPTGVRLADPVPGIPVVEAELGVPMSATRRDRDGAWYDTALPAALDRAPVDVFVGTGFFLPVAWPGVQAVTVHDVIFLTDPGFFTDENLALYTGRGRAAVERADGILAVSQATADATARYWAVTAPIAVTPLASVLGILPGPPLPTRAEAAERMRTRLGLPEGYVLSFAATHRRKNVDGALEVYAALPAGVRERHPLVLPGSDTPWTRPRIEQSGVDAILLPPHLPGDAMAALYTAADALLHPSRGEGFGLPVLDAMTCGTPVVAADNTSIPEVAGDAALLRDADDTAELASALTAVLTDAALADRLRVAGRARAAAFSWSRTAAETERLLESLVR